MSGQSAYLAPYNLPLPKYRRHIVVVQPGPHLLSDVINSSAILAGDRGIPDEVLAESTGGEAGGAAGGFEFGVDPSLDPELAMVRLSFHRHYTTD